MKKTTSEENAMYKYAASRGFQVHIHYERSLCPSLFGGETLMSKKTQQTILSVLYLFFCFYPNDGMVKTSYRAHDTGFLSLFGWYLVISFLFYLLKLKWVYVFPIKLVYICWVIIHIYTDLSFLSIESFEVNLRRCS